MRTIVLVRHGESLWNREQRFTGWTDVELTALGAKQASCAGMAIADAGLHVDVAITSSLRRAIDSQTHILKMVQTVRHRDCLLDWRLNERHYGALTGLDRQEAEAIYGASTVHQWRRGYAHCPPRMEISEAHTLVDRLSRSHGVTIPFIPRAESLRDTFNRVKPSWIDTISPLLRLGRCVLISAHGNSLRMLIAAMHGTNPSTFCEMDIPNATPMVYELDSKLRVRNVRYLNTGIDSSASKIL